MSSKPYKIWAPGEGMSDGDDAPLLTPEAHCANPPAVGSVSRSLRGGADVGEDDEGSPLLTPEALGASPTNSFASQRNRKRARDSDGGAPSEATGGRHSYGSQLSHLSRADSRASLMKSWSVASFGVAPSAEKYQRIAKVGVGAYGNVFKAENTETKEIVAIKATFRKEDPILGGFPLSLLREVCILRRVQHENIVQIHEVAQTANGDPLIVMEFCQASLLELISSQKHDLSFSEIKYITRQLLDATNHLHEHGILHRDLATKNVLFNNSGVIKICDFGISRMAFGRDEEFGYLSARDLEDPNMIVSLPYRAIELLLGDRRYGPALDVWSVGCIFAEVLLYRSGRRLPLFSGSLEKPNKTPEAFVEEIFSIMGRPTEETWPGLHRLSNFRNFSNAKTSSTRTHENPGDEKVFVRHFFMSGDGKPANTKYCLTESCFEMFGGLLALCPVRRYNAAQALEHSFFKEKPVPEWHAWHWDLEQSEILRGDDARRECYKNDEATQLLKELSKEDLVDNGAGEPLGSNGPKSKRVLERWKKQAEERMASDKRLPPGWTKHWSSSRQRYYYHDRSTGRNQWQAPN